MMTAQRGITLINYTEIVFDDLSQDLQIVANDCGIDIARLILQKLPGVILQITYKVDKTSTTYKLLLEKLGNDITKKMYEKLKGLTLNIPKSLPRSFIDRYIQKNFDGKNIKNIAIDLNLSEKTIYNILNRGVYQLNEEEENLFKGYGYE